MRKYSTVLLPILLAAALYAQTAPPSTTATKTLSGRAKAKPTAMATKKVAAARELQLLRNALETQQQSIQQLRDEARQRDAAMQQLQQQFNTLQAAAQQAQTAAQNAASTSQQNTAALAQVQTTVNDLKTNTGNLPTAFQKAEKRIDELEHPAQIHYRGVTITPGGFVAGYGILRSHNTGSDATSNFGGIPFSGSSNAHLSEFRFTARHSNLNVMGQGTVRGIKTTGYFEMDFEGAAPTANENITNSFTPRIREFWVNAELKSGVSFLGGQAWELTVPNRKGIAPKTEFRPATIDASYVVGYHYSRETMFRLTDKVNDKFAVAFALENPETVTQGSGAPAACTTAVPCLVPGVQGTGFAAVTSTDQSPDVAAKIAFDPGWGHYEIGGIARFFRSRLVTTANVPDGGTSNTNVGGAFAFNAILPLVPKKVDFYLETLAGRGLGRFLPGGGVDVIVKPDGNLIPVKAAGAMAGFAFYPTANVEFNVYGGTEYYGRTVYLNATGGQVGYGVTTADLRACSVEVAAVGACNAVNRDIWELTPVLWHRFYRGREGTLQWGIQYQYIHRRPWRGNAATPVGINNVVMTALRWYFP
jgi:hypothetical protein